MQILSLLVMYFDAVVVEVEKYLLLFRLALAILWVVLSVTLPVNILTKNDISRPFFVVRYVLITFETHLFAF